MNLKLKSGQKLSVLLVEDEQLTRTALREYLESLQLFSYIVEAQDGAVAQQKLENQRFDLIITDLVMPKVRGFDLIYHLRVKEEKDPKGLTPIMILSEKLTKKDITESLRWKVKHIVQKPCSSEDFLKKVTDIISKEKAEKLDFAA